MQNNINLISIGITFAASLAAMVLALFFGYRRRFGLALVCAACFIALFRPSVAMAAPVMCKPYHYPDGDTFYFREGGSKVRVRVAGFDAPERGQPFSKVATQRMRQLTQLGALCDCYKQDRYGRNVCNVRTPQGVNVATLMLADGLGCIDPRYEREASAVDRRAARAALRQAQQDKRGMWSQPNPVCGFDYRRAKRAK